MKLHRKGWQILAASLFLALHSTWTSAELVTVTGTNFDVTYDDANSNEALGLYGIPQIIGNTIVFLPTGFEAESIDGQGNMTTTSSVTFSIVAKGTNSIDTVSVLERGRYSLSGAGSTVTHSGNLDVSDIANFYFFNETFTTDAPTDINDGQLHNWQGSASVDIAGGPMFVNPSTQVSVNLSNDLIAFTQNGTIPSRAFIEKFQSLEPVILGVNEVPNPTAVPIPAALWLFGSGLLGIGGIARRRRLNKPG